MSATPRSTRAQIIDVAVSRFAERGYAATSMRNIAAAVGIEPASLYSHFGSKEDILWIIVQDAIREIDEISQVGASENPMADLVAFVERHVTYHALHPHKARVVNSTMRSLDPTRFAEVRAFRARYEKRLHDILIAGQATGEFAVVDAKLTTYAILQMGMAISEWFKPRGTMTVEQVCRSYVDMAVKLTGRANATPDATRSRTKIAARR